MLAEFRPLDRARVHDAFVARQNAGGTIIKITMTIKDEGQLARFPQKLIEIGDIDGESLIFGTIGEFPSSLEFTLSRERLEIAFVSLFSIVNADDLQELKLYLDQVKDVVSSLSISKFSSCRQLGTENRFVIKSQKTGDVVGGFNSMDAANCIRHWAEENFDLELVVDEASA